MSATIQHDDARRLLNLLQRGDDPLGLDREETGGAPACTDGVRLVVQRMLSGEIAVPHDAGVVLIDPITAHLLRHMGVDPLAAAALCHAAKGLGIVDVLEGDRIATLMSSAPLNLVYADPLRWESTPGILIAPAVPDTAVATLAGRRLAAVLSHPALDPLDIEITDAFVHDGGRWMTLNLACDHPDVLLGREGLSAVAHSHPGDG